MTFPAGDVEIKLNNNKYVAYKSPREPYRSNKNMILIIIIVIICVIVHDLLLLLLFEK